MNTASNANYNAQVETALRAMPASDFLRLLEDATPDQLDKLAKLGDRSRARLAMPLGSLLKAEAPTGVISIIRWWEARRPFYNLLIGLSGLPALFLVTAYTHTSAFAILSSIFCYAAAANVCYTFGHCLSLLAWMRFKGNSAAVAPTALVIGSAFSVLLTFSTALVILMSLLIAL